MKSDQRWTVRVERQPHRDAVRRLRKAYGSLWQMSALTSTTAQSNEKAEKAKYQTTTGSDFEARNCDKISRRHRRRLATKTAITVARSAFTG